MSKQTYSVSTQRQLVDLNGDTTNFDLTFSATSKDGSHFDVLVVDQATLDSNPNLTYKTAEGTISGNIVADKNVYQNYFLIMKAAKPCEVEVTIEKREVPPNLPPPPAPPQRRLQPTMKPPEAKKKTNWRTILLVMVVIGGGILLYYMYNRKAGPSDLPIESGSATAVASPSPAPSVPSASTSNLLGRLRQLPVGRVA